MLLLKETTGPSLSCCAAVDDGDEGVFQVAELLGQPGLAVAAHQLMKVFDWWPFGHVTVVQQGSYLCTLPLSASVQLECGTERIQPSSVRGDADRAPPSATRTGPGEGGGGPGVQAGGVAGHGGVMSRGGRWKGRGGGAGVRLNLVWIHTALIRSQLRSLGLDAVL
ncbi:unnamed protein product [Boreogadus saida]